MALCSRCGGGFDFYPLLKRAPTPPVEADPFCPVCGERRQMTCSTCAGSGFATSEGRLLRGYCTNCGKAMQVAARGVCPTCHGRGLRQHRCTARILPEGVYRSLAERPTVALIQRSRSRALVRLQR